MEVNCLRFEVSKFVSKSKVSWVVIHGHIQRLYSCYSILGIENLCSIRSGLVSYRTEQLGGRGLCDNSGIGAMEFQETRNSIPSLNRRTHETGLDLQIVITN